MLFYKKWNFSLRRAMTFAVYSSLSPRIERVRLLSLIRADSHLPVKLMEGNNSRSFD